MITREDFQVIADELRVTRPKRREHEEMGHFACAVIQWRKCVAGVADALARTNPRFNRSTFYDRVLRGLGEDFKAAIREPDVLA